MLVHVAAETEGLRIILKSFVKNETNDFWILSFNLIEKFTTDLFHANHSGVNTCRRY